MVRTRCRTQFSQRTAYGLLCSITEFVDHERRAMSTDHRLDSAWFGTGAAIETARTGTGTQNGGLTLNWI